MSDPGYHALHSKEGKGGGDKGRMHRVRLV